MGKARAEIEVTASSQKLAADLNAASAQFKTWAAATARAADRSFARVGKNIASNHSRMGSATNQALGHFAGNMLTRGFDKVTEAAGDVRDFERDLTRLGITAKLGPGKLSELRDGIRQVSKDTAINSSEVEHAVATYVDLTGDVEGASVSMRTFARVAQASGSATEDIATASAALGDALHIKPEEFESTFSGLISQGKAGAVTLKDFAAELTGLAPKFARFGGASGREGAMQLGAALQVARHGFGSASEAATGLESLFGALTKNAAKFEAQGIKIFDVHKDGTKTFRNLHEIVTAIGASKLAKDPTLLAKAFGRKEAEATFNQLNRLAPMYDQMVEAGRDVFTVGNDLGTFLESPAGKLDQTLNTLKEKVAEAFTPERVAAFVDGLSKAAEVLGTIVDSMAKLKDFITGEGGEKNPFKEDIKPTEADALAMVAGGPFGLGNALTEDTAKKMRDRATGGAAQTRAAAMFLPPGTAGDEARKKLANSAAFDTTYAGITGESTRTGRIRAAMRAKMVLPGEGGPGAEGQIAAAQKFLADEKVPTQEQNRLSSELATQLAAAKGSIDLLIDAVNRANTADPKATPKVEVTANAIASGAKKSTNARSGR